MGSVGSATRSASSPLAIRPVGVGLAGTAPCHDDPTAPGEPRPRALGCQAVSVHDTCVASRDESGPAPPCDRPPWYRFGTDCYVQMVQIDHEWGRRGQRGRLIDAYDSPGPGSNPGLAIRESLVAIGFEFATIVVHPGRGPRCRGRRVSAAPAAGAGPRRGCPGRSGWRGRRRTPAARRATRRPRRDRPRGSWPTSSLAASGR